MALASLRSTALVLAVATLTLAPGAQAARVTGASMPSGPLVPMQASDVTVFVEVACSELMAQGPNQPTTVDLMVTFPPDKLLVSGLLSRSIDRTACAAAAPGLILNVSMPLQVTALREAPGFVPIQVHLEAGVPGGGQTIPPSSPEGKDLAFMPGALFLLEARSGDKARTADGGFATFVVDVANFGNVPVVVHVRQTDGTATIGDVDPLILDRGESKPVAIKVFPGKHHEATAGLAFEPAYQLDPGLTGPPAAVNVVVREDSGLLHAIPGPSILPFVFLAAVAAALRRRL